jgi:hypothetical protein
LCNRSRKVHISCSCCSVELLICIRPVPLGFGRVQFEKALPSKMASVIFEMFLAKTVKFTFVCRVTPCGLLGAYVVQATSVCIIRADGGGSRFAWNVVTVTSHKTVVCKFRVRRGALLRCRRYWLATRESVTWCRSGTCPRQGGRLAVPARRELSPASSPHYNDGCS